MMTLSKRCAGPVSFSTLLIVCTALSVRAAEPPTGQPPDRASDDVLKEQTIYIPYEKLQSVFETEGRGVFLPYEQFQELWQAAHEATRKPPPQPPPVRALITEVMSEAEVVADVVSVTSRVRIEVLTEGWHEIPLRLGDAAITSARIAGQPARIIADHTGHLLLHHKVGGEPEELELVLEYAKAFTRSPGQNSVSFEAPQAPVSRWRVRVPESGVDVNIEPLIAATEVPAPAATEAAPEETVVLAFVGAAPQVKIDWTPHAEGATGLNALVTVNSVLNVSIHEGVVRSQAKVTYDISRAPLSKILLQVPIDHRVVSVSDANIRQWTVAAKDDIQELTVDLFEPAQGRQTVVIDLERFTDVRADTAPEEFEIPVVQAVGVGRQQGTIAVAVAEDLRADVVRRAGLVQIETSGLSPLSSSGHTAARWHSGYRYTALPFELTVSVEKIKPHIILDTLVEAVLEPEELTLHVQAVYNITKAGLFHLELNVPSGYEIRNRRGLSWSGLAPIVIEGRSHTKLDDGSTQVAVNLRKRALGRVGFAFDLHKKLNEPDLLTPSGKAAVLAIDFPRMAPAGVERASGRFVLYAAESVRGNPTEIEGLRSVPRGEALDGMVSCVQHSEKSRSPGRSAAGVFAYTFAEEPFKLNLKAERRKPHVTTRQLLTAAIETGVIKYAAKFFYDIRYSGVDSLRIDVPATLAPLIKNDTPGISDAAIDPPPDDVPAGYVAWQFRADKPFKGNTAISLTWETEVKPLDIGESVTAEIPRLITQNVDRAWGQIILAKAETMDIRPSGGTGSEEPLGVRPIDPRHDLMDGVDPATARSAARAFEFHDEWQLAVIATRYELQEVKRTSIERAFIRTVATRSGQISTQALYRMRSVRQRLTVKLPKDVQFDSDPVRINNRPVPLERGQEDQFVIPLSDQAPDTPFLLDIRYTVPSDRLQLACPTFPSEPAAQKTYLGMYLPTEWEFLGSMGPWTDDLDWRVAGVKGFEPYPRRGDAELVSWVTQGVAGLANPSETFQTDGRFYLFSTLRLLPPPAGSLTLVTLHEDLLDALILGIVVIMGLVLLRGGSTIRIYAVGSFLATLILLGVFFPTFSRQIMDATLASAILLVAFIWLVEYFAWRRPRDPEILARREALQQLRLAGLRAAATTLARAPVIETPSGTVPSSDSGQPATPDNRTEHHDETGFADKKGGNQDA